ncbi:MAG TPA: hypothetical protein VGN15_09750, partial [Ktedonobacteraceae bacterium]|nr:hypothetical protein [Ktedonobacteraceae bacterium]
MFSAIAQLHFQATRGREHIWHSEGNEEYLLAGAVLSQNILRVRLLRGAEVTRLRQRPQDTQADLSGYQLVDGVHGTLPYHSWSVIKGDEQWPHTLSDEQARATLEPYLHGFAISPDELRLSRPLASNERIYGLGERTGDMNKRGQAFPIWNIDPHKGHNPKTKTMYTSIPFYLGLTVEDGR